MSYFIRIESVLNQCRDHILTGVTDQEKLDLSNAVKAAFKDLEKAIEAHQDVDLDKYDILWHQSLRFLQWTKDEHTDFNKDFRAVSVQKLKQKQTYEFLDDGLKSYILSNMISYLDYFRPDKKGGLIQAVATSTQLAFKNYGSSQQVARVFENTNRICEHLEGAGIINDFVLRMFYQPAYNVYKQSLADLRADRKMIRKSIEIGIHPHFGNKYKALLFTQDHVFERMKYFGHKFADPDNPTFDVVKSLSYEQVFKDCGLYSSKNRKLKWLYEQHRQHGYIEVRGNYSDGLYRRYYFKDLTFDQLKNIVLPSTEEAQNAAKNNIKFKLVTKNVNCDELVKQKVLKKQLTTQPLSQVFVPSGNFKKDRKALRELYKTFKEGNFDIRVSKAQQKNVPKPVAKTLGPGKTQEFVEEDYEVADITADKFAKLICPRPGAYREVSFYDPNKTHYAIGDNWTYTGDGFVPKNDICWSQLVPVGRIPNPPKQFTVECIVHTDSDTASISESGHASLRLTTPSGEEYLVGFFPSENFAVDHLGLQSGGINKLDYYIFVPHKRSKAVFHLYSEEDFRKMISWIEAQQKQSFEDNLPYHPLYKNCACFVRDAVDFMEKNCQFFQSKSMGSKYQKARETVKQYAMGAFLRLPFVGRITHIDEDMTRLNGKKISLLQALGEKSKLPFLPALLRAHN